jgi:zinc/manganese transport system permease protein
MAIATSVTLLVFAIIYRPLVVESFDPLFMRAMKGHGGIYHVLFLILVVLNLVAGFQALGTLMAVGLMIMPAIVARFWVRSLIAIMVLAGTLALLASLVGLVLSNSWNVPSGPAIILTLGFIYILSLFLGRFDSIRARYFPFRHFEA